MTIQKGLFALHEFATNLDTIEIRPYLDELVNLLLSYINSHQFNRDIKYWALNALGSVVSCACKRILPYLQ